MKFSSDKIKVFGDTSFRGRCPLERDEQVFFFEWLRATHYDISRCASHVRNEGLRSYGQARWQKAEGLSAGMPDVVILGAPSFACEIKRADHTKSRWQRGQIECLEQAYDMGAFVCVALGGAAASAAFLEWLKIVRVNNELRND